MPGVYPYTRGLYANMYLLRPWTVGQYASFYTAEESKSLYRSNIRQGQGVLLVAFDLLTRREYDSDRDSVTGKVGMVGVAINSVG